jgi:hypothetical protein
MTCASCYTGNSTSNDAYVNGSTIGKAHSKPSLPLSPFPFNLPILYIHSHSVLDFPHCHIILTFTTYYSTVDTFILVLTPLLDSTYSYYTISLPINPILASMKIAVGI